MSRFATIGLSVLLAVTFAWAGGLKVLRPDRWRSSLATYGLPRLLRGTAFLVTPWVELGVATALVLGFIRIGAGTAFVLTLVFCAAILRARHLQRSDKLDCGCFGGHTERDYRLLLLRNAVLGAAAVALLAAPADEQPLLSASPAEAWAVVLSLVLGAAGWVLWQLRLHHHRVASPTPVADGP